MKISLLLAAALLFAPAVRAEEEEKEAAPAAEEKAAEAKAGAEEGAAKAEEKADKAAEKTEEKADKAADKADKKADKAKAKARAKADKAAGDDHAPAKADRGHVDSALAFLKAWSRSTRKGEQGTKAWEELKAHAADDTVEVKIGGKAHDIDIAHKKSDARLQKFSKISTWRDGNKIQGVAVEVLDVAVDKEAHHKGKAKIHMSEKDGKWLVDSIEAE